MAAREPFYVARVARLPDEGRLTDPAVKAYVGRWFYGDGFGWVGIGFERVGMHTRLIHHPPRSANQPTNHPTSLAINLREATQELHRALRSRATGHTAGGGGTTTGRAGGAPHLPSAREVCCVLEGSGVRPINGWMDGQVGLMDRWVCF